MIWKNINGARSFLQHCFLAHSVNKRLPLVMQIEKRDNHMERTAENTRQQAVSLATVIGMRDESKTVKSLALQIQSKHLTFKAGQWLDVFIPGLDIVGGYSMSSSPLKLTNSGQLDLAVKFSQHPPAYWVHTKCEVGSKLLVRVGGDFYYDPTTQSGHDLLLIAGGVGINPLYSILNHVTELQGQGGHSSSTGQAGRVMLLYSSRTEDELIFRDHLQEIEKANGNVRCQYHITRDDQSHSTDLPDNVKGSRITKENIAQCFDWLKKDRTLAYICGPSTMLTDMEHMLISAGLSKDNINYEKWW